LIPQHCSDGQLFNLENIIDVFVTSTTYLPN
jgi:hypothetical protein